MHGVQLPVMGPSACLMCVCVSVCVCVCVCVCVSQAPVFSFAICMYELLHFTHILVSILNSASLHGKNKDASIKEYAAAVAAGYRSVHTHTHTHTHKHAHTQGAIWPLNSLRLTSRGRSP